MKIVKCQDDVFVINNLLNEDADILIHVSE